MQNMLSDLVSANARKYFATIPPWSRPAGLTSRGGPSPLPLPGLWPLDMRTENLKHVPPGGRGLGLAQHPELGALDPATEPM